MDEVLSTDLILMVGSFNESQIAAVKVRQAVKEGATLVVISPEETLVDDLAALKVSADNISGLLKEVLAAVIKKGLTAGGFIEAHVEGFEEFKISLGVIEPGDNSLSVAELYARARNAMILIDGNLVNVPGVQLLADLGLITGKIGVPRNGMVLVTPGGNACGISHAGIHLCHMQFGSKLQEGKIKGPSYSVKILLSGSVKAIVSGIGAAVSTPFMTPTAELAV